MYSRIIKIAKRNFPYYNNLRLESLKGWSGDPVYMLKNNNNNICVIKVFSKEIRYIREKKSYEFLKKHNFSAVEIFNCERDAEFFYIFMSVAPGYSLREYIKNNKYNIDELTVVGYNIGRTLRTLHNISRYKILDNIGKNKLEELIKYTGIEGRTKRNFLSSPGEFCFVHGDPSPDNFFIGDDGKIVIIDAGILIKKSVDNMPRGFPACDYHRFIFTLKLCQRKLGISNIKYVINGFKDGYQSSQGIFGVTSFHSFFPEENGDIGFTPEASKLFATHWNNILNK